MRRIARLTVLGVVATLGMAQQDPLCPAYPSSTLAQYARAVTRTARRARSAGRKPADATYDPSLDVNFIDSELFQQMAKDGISPADPASDAEFLRRAMLDLTGRIPTPQQVSAYVANADPNKKTALVNGLIGTKEYVDKFTLWFEDKFQITSDYYNFIGVPGRTLMYNFVRNFVAADGSYQDFVTALVSAAGDSHRIGPPNFTMRGIQYSQPIQDTWDELTNDVTTYFLGVQTQCISCHNGRGHLEPINLFLSKKTRLDFWKQSAFFSRMNILLEADDPSGSEMRGLLTDRAAGGYNSVLADPNNPGPRPPRTGGPYSAVYLFNGNAPSTGAWRAELAKAAVNDRQFARALVNYLWAYFFRVGIVDPPDGFDPARLDAANPPKDIYPATGQPWPLQPSHPALLEKLTDAFIAGGYRLSPVIRLMTQSRAYGLSGTYNGTWDELHALDFAKSMPRRLNAEEIYDAMVDATNTVVPMTVAGIPYTLYHAGELPDPTEPNIDPARGVDQYGYIRDFLTAMGRGDWWRTSRDNSLNPSIMLFYMNSPTVVERTLGNTAQLGHSLVAQLAASPATADSDAVTQICLAALGRLPTAAEMAAALAYPKPDPSREQWLSDIQWVFLHEAEFFFNH